MVNVTFKCQDTCSKKKKKRFQSYLELFACYDFTYHLDLPFHIELSGNVFEHAYRLA